MIPQFQDFITHIQTLVESVLAAVNPTELTVGHLGSIEAMLRPEGKCWLVGAGKASLEMALAVNERLGAQIAGGAVAVVPERLEMLDQDLRERLPFSLYPAMHPLASEQNLAAAKAIGQIALRARVDDLLLVLLSGGGSAHLALPVDGLGLDTYQQLTDQLMKAGAAIQEINAVRKHAEQLKGGGLLRLAAPARVHALVLSDVIGDPLDVIASGPVSADRSTYADAYEVLTRYGVAVPPVLLEHFEAGMRGEWPETLKPGDPLLDLASHAIIGNNDLAVEAARLAAERMGFSVVRVETGVQGEARDLGARLGEVAREMRLSADLPAVAIFGGETTVTVRGNGKGGRNQEIVLGAALAVEAMEGVGVMSFATDGIDGPTDAAGAYADGDTCRQARSLGFAPGDYLENNDSYIFFEAMGALLKTGPSGTNVNDVSMAFVYPFSPFYP